MVSDRIPPFGVIQARLPAVIHVVHVEFTATAKQSDGPHSTREEMQRGEEARPVQRDVEQRVDLEHLIRRVRTAIGRPVAWC